MADVIRFPGTVEWSGENPGISLKSDPNGPFTTLASFFRIVLSPHGRGHVLVLVRPASEFVRTPAVCLTDNEPLARWLVQEFVTKFGAFQGIAAMHELIYRKLDSVETAGDPTKSPVTRTTTRSNAIPNDFASRNRSLDTQPAIAK